MSAELTPIEKLDEAIRAYIVECDESGELGGWALSYQTVQIVSDPALLPLAFGWQWTLGPSTSAALAIGLLRVAQVEAETIATAGS